MTEESRPFAGSRAVVTGATSGIGRAVALRLASMGAHVCVVGRSHDALADVTAAVVERGGLGSAFRVDLSDDHQVEEMAEKIADDPGGIDILVHSAGMFSRGPVESAPIEDFDRQFRVNTRAPYLLTRLLLPGLRARKGQVIFINSTAGLRSHSGVSQYAGSKFALKAVADALREEVNEDGIRVTSVFPGRTATPMQKEVSRLEGKEYRPDHLMQPEDVAELVSSILALPRSAEVTEVTVRQMRTG